MKLWEHQQLALDFVRDRDYKAILSLAMGLGKTAIAITAMREHDQHFYLVLAPKATLGHWESEIEKWWPNATVITRRRNEKVDKFKQRLAAAKFGGPQVIVMNYEWFRLRQVSEVVSACCLDGVVFDESHRLADRKSLQSRRAKALADNIGGLRLCLSGTVFSHSPLSVWHQARLIDKDLFGMYYPFEHRYANHYTIPGVQAKLIRSYKNLDQLASEFRKIAFVASSEEWQPELLEPIFINAPFKLSQEGRETYNSMARDMFAQVGLGLIAADNALVKALRLQELTSGVARLNDAVAFIHEDRVKVLKELIESIPEDRPVVVFYQYDPERRQIQRAAAELGRGCLTISGADKSGLTDKGKLAGDAGEVVAVQIGAGSEGIDLTRSNHLIFYRRGFRYSSYLQAIKRIHRPGQKRQPFVWTIMAEETIDEVVGQSLARRENMTAQLLLSHLKEASE